MVLAQFVEHRLQWDAAVERACYFVGNPLWALPILQVMRDRDGK